MDLYNPTLADLNAYSVVNGQDIESLRQPLYDWQIYPTAGQGQLQFFQNQVGQGVTSALGATATTAKTVADTNMTLSGQLSAGINFLMESIEVGFEPGSVSTTNTYTNYKPVSLIAVPTVALTGGPNDTDTIRQSGWLSFSVLSKNYLTFGPLGNFPMMTHLTMDAAVATNSATTLGITALASHWAGRPFYMQPLVTIPSNMNFNLNLNWPGALATPSGFNARIGITIDGIQFRNTQ